MPANPALHAKCLVYPDPAFRAGCFARLLLLKPTQCWTFELLQAELTAVAGLIYFHGVEPLRPNRPLVYGADTRNDALPATPPSALRQYRSASSSNERNAGTSKGSHSSRSPACGDNLRSDCRSQFSVCFDAQMGRGLVPCHTVCAIVQDRYDESGILNNSVDETGDP